jgi:protein-export SecD/SecF family membrane protein
MKGKSALILLLIIVVTCGLAAVAYFGVGHKASTTAQDDTATQQIELVTNEQGEIETDEEGQMVTRIVEATTDETDAAEDVATSAAAVYDGYGSMFNIKQGLDLKGGVYIIYRADKANPTDEEMASAISMIQTRLDAKNWTEAECSREGVDKIRVEIPGVEDAQSAVNEIGETAKLTFQNEEGDVLVDGTNVVNATKQTDSSGIVVQLEFDSEGAAAFATATEANVGKRIYIKMDDTTISAPTVNQKITSNTAVITGDFTAEEAGELANKIRAGSLPFNLIVDEYNSVGARLGANSLSSTLFAGIIGVAAVFVFMLLIYRVAGFAADLALLIYTIVDIIIMSLFGVTLTLPGIAGVVLSIGMAVDANVLIFERVREELGEGKTIANAFNNGFSRAMPAIIDSNVTTIIASAVLLWYGSGSVKGFAQTLIIGVILSMFTAIFVTKHIVNALIGLGVKNPKLYGAKSK